MTKENPQPTNPTSSGNHSNIHTQAPQQAHGAQPKRTAAIDATDSPASSASASVGTKPSGSEKKRIALLIAVIVVIAIIVGVMVSNANNRKSNPKPVVESYMNALANGNYGKAAAIADPTLSDAQKVLLQDGIISDVTKRVSSVSVGEPSQLSTTEYSVPVTYTVNGSAANSSVIVQKSGAFIATKWNFERSLLGVIGVPANNATVTINGKTPTAESNYTGANGTSASSSSSSSSSSYGLAVNIGADTIAVPAYPGYYDVTAQSSSKYLDIKLSDSAYTVPAQGSVNVNGTIEANDALATEITNQLKDHQQKCVDNANAGGADDNSCYVNASYMTKAFTEKSVFGDWKYTFKNAEVAKQPDISASSLSSTTADDGSMAFEFVDNGSVKVNYTKQLQDDKPVDTDTTAYGTGSYWGSTYLDATIDGDTVTINYNDIYSKMFNN